MEDEFGQDGLELRQDQQKALRRRSSMQRMLGPEDLSSLLKSSSKKIQELSVGVQFEIPAHVLEPVC